LLALSNAGQLAAASEAASALLLRFGQLLQACGARPASLLSRIQHEAALVGWANQDAILANLIGLLSQTHEATAGLIGNSLVALLSRPQLQKQLRRDRDQIGSLVREVARFDPAVQNTRRFVAQPTSVAGISLLPGDTILLLLAAAGRDPQANAHPNEFMLARPQRQLFGFGHGRHACPGQTIAITIATAALDTILSMPTALDAQRIGWTYRASANARLPLFSTVAKLAPRN
jgi:cytochrome P450